MEIENEYDFEISEQDAEKIHTIQQVVKYIKEHKKE